MDADELDYLEKRALASPVRRRSSAIALPARPRHKIAYHSQLTGEGFFGISAYGLIVLSFLVLAALFFYAIAYGLLYWLYWCL
ncbi:hypothetical protein LTR08_000325 [Meristemomyces frigidus]|nr:hypothetical protein LTR08_000325 [Meristemomyces frigidus]